MIDQPGPPADFGQLAASHPRAPQRRMPAQHVRLFHRQAAFHLVGDVRRQFRRQEVADFLLKGLFFCAQCKFHRRVLLSAGGTVFGAGETFSAR